MINILISVIKSDTSKLNIPKYKSNNLNIVINTVKNIFNINDTLYALYVINNLLISVKSLLSIEKKKGDESTSLYSKRGGNSTVDLFNSPSYRALHPEQFESTSNGSSSSTEESSSSSK